MSENPVETIGVVGAGFMGSGIAKSAARAGLSVEDPRIKGTVFRDLDQRLAPPPLLKRMVVSGHHGRKSGRGVYEYGNAPAA